MNHPREHYPSPREVDDFCGEILSDAEGGGLQAELLGDGIWPFRAGVRHTAARYVRFSRSDSEVFYGIWQPCTSGRGPLLVHVPGYGAEMSTHPELVADGYNVLHVNPLGYATAEGPDEAKRPSGRWPVLPDTARSAGRQGYRQWLAHAAAATLWGLEREGVEEGRFAFFGSSQGGGGALLLASLFYERGVRAAAADVPFLTNFPLMYGRAARGAYEMAFQQIDALQETAPERMEDAWRGLGLIDTTSHCHRLDVPVLLTAGLEDATCPAVSIRSLFDLLPGTHSYTEISGQGHAYTPAFLQLARAWFRLHV